MCEFNFIDFVNSRQQWSENSYLIVSTLVYAGPVESTQDEVRTVCQIQMRGVKVAKLIYILFCFVLLAQRCFRWKKKS